MILWSPLQFCPVGFPLMVKGISISFISLKTDLGILGHLPFVLIIWGLVLYLVFFCKTFCPSQLSQEPTSLRELSPYPSLNTDQVVVAQVIISTDRQWYLLKIKRNRLILLVLRLFNYRRVW